MYTKKFKQFSEFSEALTKSHFKLVIISIKNTFLLDHLDYARQSGSMTVGVFFPLSWKYQLDVVCLAFLLSSSVPVLSRFWRKGSRAMAGVVFALYRAKISVFQTSI